MNAGTIEPDLYRSEAFAEDVFELVASAPVSASASPPARAPMRWVVPALPLAAALPGVAAAAVPPPD